MSERYCAWIRIGGQIKHSSLEPFLKAICQSYVRLNWGEPHFEPKTIDELREAEQDDWLWLCDEDARHGEFSELEEVCRKLGLAYKRSCEAWCGYDAELVDWRPGMEEPLFRTCSNEDYKILLVDVGTVAEALVELEARQIQNEINKLRNICPQVPDLPPFEIV